MHYDKQIAIEALQKYMENVGPDTKIFYGADSTRYKTNGIWYADYTCVIVIHIDGCHGGKVFAEVSREKDHDQKVDRPFTRLMTEAQKVAELYLRTKEVFYDYLVEIHLDIASNESMGSFCAAKAAVGYIQSLCQVTPLLKPDSFAASFGADRGADFYDSSHRHSEAA